MSADNPTYNLISLRSVFPTGTGISPSIPGWPVVFPVRFSTSVGFSGSFGEPISPPYIEHPWLSPENGLVPYLRIMRGEDRLPHIPNNCDECRKIFRAQISLLSENGMGNGLGPGKRHKKKNPGRQKMQARMDRIRGRLQILAQHEAHHEHRH